MRDTLASATATADKLPSPLGEQVLHTARGAFVQEYHVVAILSAVVLTIVAAVIVAKLHRLPAFGSNEQAAH